MAGRGAATPVSAQPVSSSEGGGCSGATPISMARIRRRSPRVVAVRGGGVGSIVVVVLCSRWGERKAARGSVVVKVGREDEV